MYSYRAGGTLATRPNVPRGSPETNDGTFRMAPAQCLQVGNGGSATNTSDGTYRRHRDN